MVDFLSFILGSAVGLIGYKMAKVGYRVYPYFLKDTTLLTQQKIRAKRIAIISGSTDGLGKAFAKRLFQDGYKLLVLGRSESKILSLINQFKQLEPNRQNFLSSYKIDFSNLTLTQTNKQITNLTQLINSQLSTPYQQSEFNKIQFMFVNSCGDAHISRYENTSVEEISRLHNVNLNSFHLMVKMMFMLKESQIMKDIGTKKEFIFINVSSGVDVMPNRYSSIYSGTKAYLSNVMKTLNLENQNSSNQQQNEQTYFLNLTPLYIKTKMVRYLKQWDVVEPQFIVNGAFKLLKRRQQGAGCVVHELLKEFPFLMKEKFNQRVEKAMEVKVKFEEMQMKKRERKNKNTPNQ